jgi:hypothetical protein
VLAPRTGPLKFATMHLKIQDARPLKRTASAAEANKLLGETLRLVGVKKDVFATVLLWCMREGSLVYYPFSFGELLEFIGQ